MQYDPPTIKHKRVAPIAKLEISIYARNMLPARWLARFPILDAHNQSRDFLAANLTR